MNIKIKFWILLLLTSCLFFVSCDNKDSETSTQMILSDGVVMFTKDADTKLVAVINGGNWSVTVPEDASGWCSAEKEDGGEDESDFLAITVSKNTAVELRETVLTIKNGNEQKTLPVRQMGDAPLIRFTAYDYAGESIPLSEGAKNLLIPYDIAAFEVKVSSNVPFEVITTPNSWIQVTAKVPGTGDETTIKFAVEENLNVIDRGIEVIFQQADGDYYVLLPVKQRQSLGGKLILTNEMFAATAQEGAIKLSWTFPEEQIYNKIIFEYDDMSTATVGDKLTKTVAYSEGYEVTVDGLLAKYGDIIFNVEVLNADGESLVQNDGGFSFSGGTCIPVQSSRTVKVPLETEKVDLSVQATDGGDPDGLKWVYFSGMVGGSTNSKYESLFDGIIPMTNNVNYWESENRNNPPTGLDYSYIIIQVPDDVEITHFTIKTVNEWNQISQAPGLYTVSIGGSAVPEADDWEVVFEQATKEWKYGDNFDYDIDTEEHDYVTMPTGAAVNNYRYKTLRPMTSTTEGKVVKFIKYAVSDRNNTAARNDYFKLSEFELHKIVTILYDPENE